jgi:hypothetical protein
MLNYDYFWIQFDASESFSPGFSPAPPAGRVIDETDYFRVGDNRPERDPSFAPGSEGGNAESA